MCPSTALFKANIYKVTKKIAEYDIQPQNTYNLDEKGFLLGVLQKMKRVFTKNARKKGLLLSAA